MILVLPTACKITDDILDNKVLIYTVCVNDKQVIAEGKLVTIREVVDCCDNKSDPPSSVAEAVRRYNEFQYGDLSATGRELVEAVFDQESADHRADALNEWGNNSSGIECSFGHIGACLISALYRQLPELVDYAC